MTTDPILREVRSLVGRSYAEFDCYGLVRHAFRLRGIELDPSFYEEVAAGRFRTVSMRADFLPDPWDVIAIRNHPLWSLHVGIALGGREFIHSLEQTGVAISRTDQQPWCRRINGFSRYDA